MTVLNVLSFVLTAGALGAAWYFYRKSQKEKAPVWAWETYSAFGGGLPSRFKLVFGAQEVQRVSVTKIVFWNAGRDAIRESDIVEPVEFTFPEGCQVLEVEPESVSRPQIDIAYEVSPDHVRLKFLFLDCSDGVAMIVRHTGDSATKPAARGTIVGAPSGIRNLGLLGEFRLTPRGRGQWVPRAMSVLLSLGVLLLTIAVVGRVLLEGFGVALLVGESWVVVSWVLGSGMLVGLLTSIVVDRMKKGLPPLVKRG